MKNRKGFTIIELLAVIVILGLIMGIAIPAVNKTLADFRTKYYTKLEKSMESAGKSYLSDKKNAKPTDLLNSKIIEGDSLVENKYLSDILDYNKHNCTDSYVVAVKFGDKDYKYQACLKCPEDEYQTDTSNDEYDLCNSAWKSNDYITSGGAESSSEIFYVYYGTSKKEVEREVGISYGITKSDSDGKVLATVTEGGEDAEVIYPVNINELVNANLDQVITLRYTMPDGRDVSRDAMLFRYDSPDVKVTYTNGNKATGKAAGVIYVENNWANSLDFELTFAAGDRTKYSAIISKNTKLTVEYYNYSKKSWINGGSCSGTGLLKCKITYSDNFEGKLKFRLKDDKGNASKETRDYEVKVDKVSPIVKKLMKCKEISKNGELIITDKKECTELSFTKNGNNYAYSNNEWDGRFIYVLFDNSGGGSPLKLEKGIWNNRGTFSKLLTGLDWSVDTPMSDFGFFDYGQREGYFLLYDEAGNNLKFDLRMNISAEIDITLDRNGGSGGTSTIYEIYGIGFATSIGSRVQKNYDTPAGTSNTHKFYDEDITYFSSSHKITIPSKSGYVFKGYYTSKTGGTKIIDSNGSLVSGANNKLFDENQRDITGASTAKLYAQWSHVLDFTITNPTNGNWTKNNITLTFNTISDSEEIEGWYYTYKSDLTASNTSNVGTNHDNSWVKYPNSAGKKSYRSTEFSAERNNDVYIMICLNDGRCLKKSTTIKIDKTAPHYSTSLSRNCDSLAPGGYIHCWMPVLTDNGSGVHSRCITTTGGEDHCDNYSNPTNVTDELNTFGNYVQWTYGSTCDAVDNCTSLGPYRHSW